MRKINKKLKKCVENIGGQVGEIIERVGNTYYSKNNKKVYFKIIPTPFDIAESYGISIEYIKMSGDILAYFRRKSLTIYISDRYIDDKYKSQQLVAHELGHFILDTSFLSAMNDDELNERLTEETMKEYYANVFAIFLMPQIMGNEEWKNWSPNILNRRVYRKIFIEDE